jgi:hypothetical protein
MKYTLEKLEESDRWEVTCPDASTFHTSSLDEALAFLRKHREAAALDAAMGFLRELQQQQRDGGDDV